jgi:hypothetical protein
VQGVTENIKNRIMRLYGEPVIRSLTKSINKTLYNTNTEGFIFAWAFKKQ